MHMNFSYISSWIDFFEFLANCDVWNMHVAWPTALAREIGHFHLLPEEVLVPLSQNFSWCSQFSRKILQAEDPPDGILLGFISYFLFQWSSSQEVRSWIPHGNFSFLRLSFLSCVGSSHRFCQWGLSVGEMLAFAVEQIPQIICSRTNPG